MRNLKYILLGLLLLGVCGFGHCAQYRVSGCGDPSYDGIYSDLGDLDGNGQDTYALDGSHVIAWNAGSGYSFAHSYSAAINGAGLYRNLSRDVTSVYQTETWHGAVDPAPSVALYVPPVIGCMDSSATNYNPSATQDTSPTSCAYATTTSSTTTSSTGSTSSGGLGGHVSIGATGVPAVDYAPATSDIEAVVAQMARQALPTFVLISVACGVGLAVWAFVRFLVGKRAHL